MATFSIKCLCWFCSHMFFSRACAAGYCWSAGTVTLFVVSAVILAIGLKELRKSS